MTSFVHREYAMEHSGVVRAEQAAQAISHAVKNFNGTRATATLLLAAVVSALVVAANQVVGTWSDNHLMAAWITLWTVAFAAIGLLASPLLHVAKSLRRGLTTWSVNRRQAEADQKLWSVALTDARVMADISRAMASDAETTAPVFQAAPAKSQYRNTDAVTVSDAERNRQAFLTGAAMLHMGR
jgi:hypothetical protein